ncbi:MAG: hypothetical protein U1F37_05780 [Alphaproteobacteria bacterium]
MTEIGRRGLMLVLSSPSGAGKTTISRRLLAAERERMALSVSVTTRPARPGEVEGRDYFFIDKPRSLRKHDGRTKNCSSTRKFLAICGTPKTGRGALSRGQDVTST